MSLRLGLDREDELLGRAVSQRESGELALETGLADVAEVGAVAGSRTADAEDRTPESHGECDRADSLAAVNHRRPLSGPLHARPPAS